MNKEIFIKWNNSERGGIFKISTKFDTISYEIVSGAAVPFWDLMSFLWASEILSGIREAVKGLTRKNPWRIQSREGMSGSKDWYIQYEKNGLVRRTKPIHCSMADKANESFVLWSKDLYDILWWMSYKGAPITEGDVTFIDITEEVMIRRKEFSSNSLPPACGFGGKTPEQLFVDEDALYS